MPINDLSSLAQLPAPNAPQDATISGASVAPQEEKPDVEGMVMAALGMLMKAGQFDDRIAGVNASTINKYVKEMTRQDIVLRPAMSDLGLPFESSPEGLVDDDLGI